MNGWSPLIAEYGSTGYGWRYCSWSAEQRKLIFHCPHSYLIIWSRKTSSAAPSCVSLLILRIQAESGVCSRDSSRFPRRRPIIYTIHRHRVSPEFIIVTQTCTDSVHCQESTGTELVALKVVRITGATYSGIPMGQFWCASLISRALLVQRTCVIQKVSEATM